MRFLIIPFICMLFGCGSEQATPSSDVVNKYIVERPIGEDQTLYSPTNRFVVEYQQTFKAGYAEHRRDILIIKDKTTGQKFIGITGCGVSEMWTERSGKATNRVEE